MPPTSVPTVGPMSTTSPTNGPTILVIEQVFGDISPQAASDIVTVGKSELAYLDVLQNDKDPEGDELVIGSVTQPGHGTVHIMEDGKVLVYIPSGNYTGLDCEFFLRFVSI